MPTVRLNKVNIYYESHGSGFPLVFAYGLGGNTGMWDGQVAAFSQHYRFIVWDPRGHGKSESPPNRIQYGQQISAEDLYELLNYLGIKKAYVGGLSLGGGIAARFAVMHPDCVAALLIINSASPAGLPISEAMLKMRRKTIELAENEGMEAVADYALKANPNLRKQAEASPEAYQRQRRNLISSNPIGYANTVRTLIEETFPTELLSTLTMPTLVLVGEEDPAMEAARLTQKKIPGSKLVVLPNAGHQSNLDCPEAFNSSVLKFLRSIKS